MESILLIGACSAFDVFGRILVTFTCPNKGPIGGICSGDSVPETEHSSVVPVLDDSSPSLVSDQVRRNVRFSQTSTISILHKSMSSDSSATTSTSGTLSTDDDEMTSDALIVSNSLPMKMDSFRSSSSNEFIEVNIASSSDHPNRFRQRLKSTQQRNVWQQHETKDRETQRHRFLGHTKWKRRVRRLLAEDIACRQRRSGIILDRERQEKSA